MTSTASAAALAGLAMLLWAGRVLRPPAPAPSIVLSGELYVSEAPALPGRPVGDEEHLRSSRGGTALLDGARVELRPGTRAAWSRAARSVTLEAGEVGIDVAPGQGRRFRVTTKRFAVEVLGTRFVVSPTEVHTERGRVRVVDLDGLELAVVAAGESWRSPGSQVAREPSPAPPPRDVEPPPPKAVEHPAAQLERARIAIAHGDVAKARELVRSVLDASPARAHAATGRALLADALLVERRRGEAIHAYLAVAHEFADLPQAETALFAAAELQFETGRHAAARRALKEYIARYPRGRFRAEAKAKLARLP